MFRFRNIFASGNVNSCLRKRSRRETRILALREKKEKTASESGEEEIDRNCESEEVENIERKSENDINDVVGDIDTPQ
ncbi:hypothetical protein NPIL_703431 [Nephila pilipes]|uniref:Uncharacterized protein n=1 Tax=Nephila pilipes TaxID=299642 RepID=A0A8X6Q5L9_NEPPI|nr:hypothetical protein NPIL_703431 [Nephila pilipes]